MNILKTLTILILVGVAQAANAACNATHCAGKINILYIDGQALYLTMDQNMSPLNCTLAGGTYLTLRMDHPQYELVSKVLMAGHLAQNPRMTVRITTATTGCSVAYVVSQLGTPHVKPSGTGTQTAPQQEPPICIKNPRASNCLDDTKNKL